MPSNKDRLYIALYARGGEPKMPGLEDTYHLAFIVGPKSESAPNSQGTRFHAKEALLYVGEPPTLQWTWAYEERPISLHPTQMLLVRVIVGKVRDRERLCAAFRRNPLQPDVPGWNCVEWAKEAFQEAVLDRRALDKAAPSWELLRDTAMWYVEKKKLEHRFDGQRQYDQALAATWDMFDGREINP
ncbi:hypothetical protein O9K51_00049 [Purpureocillium lavendulum]|uniref:Uncharacterized protein n=1 Tax=Purpureocillium lavendulum TaxID=1247861 RepID=A0AB34G4Y6_9HYPO|nr:hypothetical protein O9K51_00049 [Purpureocillium lavendulum]